MHQTSPRGSLSDHQGEKRLRLELQVLRAGLEEVGVAGQQSLEAEVDKLSRLLALHQADAHSTHSAMELRVLALETTNTRVRRGTCWDRAVLHCGVLTTVVC